MAPAFSPSLTTHSTSLSVMRASVGRDLGTRRRTGPAEDGQGIRERSDHPFERAEEGESECSDAFGTSPRQGTEYLRECAVRQDRAEDSHGKGKAIEPHQPGRVAQQYAGHAQGHDAPHQPTRKQALGVIGESPKSRSRGAGIGAQRLHSSLGNLAQRGVARGEQRPNGGRRSGRDEFDGGVTSEARR